MPISNTLDAPPSGSAQRSTVKPAEGLVFVVDDDVSVREALEAMLASEGWDVVAFESAAAFLAHSPASEPSCLVLDVGLPDLNGLDLQARIAGDRAEMPIIFITGHGDVTMTVKAMKAGAMEFLTKPFDEIAMLDAVAAALERSRKAIDDQLSLRALRLRCDSLTRRERQVMALVVQGLLNKQVGGRLEISEITVKAHRGRVMEKMKARSLAELVNMCARLGINKASET